MRYHTQVFHVRSSLILQECDSKCNKGLHCIFFYTCVPKEQETKREKGRNPGDKDDGKYNPEHSESSLDNVDT